MKSARLPTGSTTAAASLMGFQALVTVVMAFAFLTVRPRARLPLFESSLADSRDELAVGLVFAAFALCLLAFGVASLEGWARIGAIAAEAFIIVASLVRFPVHPVWTLAAVAVSMTVMLLLLADSAWDDRHGLSELAGESALTPGKGAPVHTH